MLHRDEPGGYVAYFAKKEFASRTMPHEHLLGVLHGQPTITEMEEILGDLDGVEARDFVAWVKEYVGVNA